MSNKTIADTAGLISTSGICKELGFTVNVQYINNLGIEEQVRTHQGVYWLKTDLSQIFRAIANSMFNKKIDLELARQDELINAANAVIAATITTAKSSGFNLSVNQKEALKNYDKVAQEYEDKESD